MSAGRKPVGLGMLLIGVIVVTGLGITAQGSAGAPTSAMMVQAAAGLAGLVIAIVLALTGWRPGLRGATAIAAVAVFAVLTTLADPAGGVHRWTMIGPVAVQPSLIVLPFVVWGWSGVRSSWALAGLTAAVAVLMAAQPDAAACGGLFLGLVGVAIARRSVSASEGATMAVALAATVWAATRPDDLPAVAYVERVVFEAFAANPVMGVIAGLAVVAIPGLIGWRAWSKRPEDAALLFGLTGLWVALTVAAFVGNYPVPVVGYGASSLLGWLVSLGLAARKTAASSPARFAISPRRR
jgi:hypothetical protein